MATKETFARTAKPAPFADTFSYDERDVGRMPGKQKAVAYLEVVKLVRESQVIEQAPDGSASIGGFIDDYIVDQVMAGAEISEIKLSFSPEQALEIASEIRAKIHDGRIATRGQA